MYSDINSLVRTILKSAYWSPSRSISILQSLTSWLNVSECYRHILWVNRYLGNFNFQTQSTGLEEYRKRSAAFNPDLLRHALDGSDANYLKRLVETAAKIPILTNQLYHDLPRAGMRELLVRQIAAYFKADPLTIEEDEKDSRKMVIFLLGLWAVNQGLCIRLAVHIILYADSIKMLGTEKHHSYLKRAFKLQDYGSFSLTELGHGSNASGVETTATYDHQAREFVLNTPSPMAAKWWIGAVGKTANMTVAFARLILNGVDHGVHVFLVPIRHYDTHDPLPGVILGDCGPKEGVHGIDNGFIIFQNYRVPYDALLDKFSHISVDGKLKSAMKNKDKRFAAMLSAFTRGRHGILSGTLMTMRNALTIAIRYGAVRKQFGKAGGPERSILDYPLHRFRLMPHLANLFAANSGSDLIRNMIEKYKKQVSDAPDGPEGSEIHAILSIIKPIASWYSQRCVQECRESLSGHGFSAFSGLGTLLTDNDVNSTWEGDNNVLLQQTSRYIFKNIQRMLKGQRVESEFLSFLSLDISQYQGSKAQFASKDQLRGNVQLLHKLLEYRTNLLVSRSMAKLQENGARLGDMFETWNHTQVFHMHPLAIAFGEMILADELAKVIEITKAKCAETGQVLLRLLELFVYSKVVNDLGTFRESDFVTSDQSVFLRDYVMDLCNEIAESSVTIIDAVAMPEQLIGSPFAASDGQMYKAYTQLVEKAEGCYEKASWVPLIKEVRKAL